MLTGFLFKNKFLIPDYQTLMLPLLKFISDGQLHNTNDAVNYLSKEYNLTKEELDEWLPSKKQKTFHNRVHWAKAHLKMSGAIENISKGIFKITDKGKVILAENPSSINVKYLMSIFPDYQERINGFRYTKKNDAIAVENDVVNESEETPEEQIESGYQKIRKSLEQELLVKLKSVDPYFFEKIVYAVPHREF